jgi:hypothetical protein
MADVQITCVTKTAHHHEAVTGVGGNGWWWTTEQVIQSIEAKTNTFHTLVANKRAEVAVVQGATKKYIRTHADGQWSDNLLALEACPGR